MKVIYLYSNLFESYKEDHKITVKVSYKKEIKDKFNTHIFKSQHKESIDPYYNDLLSLKLALTKFQNYPESSLTIYTKYLRQSDFIELYGTWEYRYFNGVKFKDTWKEIYHLLNNFIGTTQIIIKN